MALALTTCTWHITRKSARKVSQQVVLEQGRGAIRVPVFVHVPQKATMRRARRKKAAFPWQEVAVRLIMLHKIFTWGTRPKINQTGESGFRITPFGNCTPRWLTVVTKAAIYVMS